MANGEDETTFLCCRLSGLASPPKQAKSIAPSKNPKSRTMTLFIPFFTKTKMMAMKLPVEETKSQGVHLQEEKKRNSTHDAETRIHCRANSAEHDNIQSFPYSSGDTSRNK